MPTYSYRCTECGTAFDIQQAFTDDTLTVCPNCGGKLRKLFSAVGVSFTGSGFYRNDSREKPKSETSSGSSGKSESKSESSKSESSSGSESKPATTSSAPASSAAPAKSTPSKKD